MVERALQGRFIGPVLFCDLRGLLGALLKCVADSVGGLALLPGEGGGYGLLQRVVKLREVRLGRLAISNGTLENSHRCATHPLRANEEHRPFTWRIINHLHNCRIVAVA
jgi:hypothetical protein